MFSWKDGEEKHRGIVYRQVPQRYTWSSQVFVSSKGRAKRRFWNPISHSFTWEDVDIIEDNDRMGIRMQHFLPIETIIAMAWRRREPDTPTKVIVSPQGTTAKTVRWQHEENEDDIEHMGETWKPLSYKLGLIPCDSQYQISSHGRLKSPFRDENGKRPITRGFWWDNERWAYVKPAGLISLTRASSRERGAALPPSLQCAMDCLMTGHSPEDLADSQGIQEGSAWTYFCRVVPHIKDKVELRRRGKELVPPDLWRLLKRMKKDEDALLGGRLLDLIAKCEHELDEFMDEEFKFEQLRFARSILLA